MAPRRTITAANATFMLTVPDLFGGVPQQMQGFATDDVFTIEAQEITATEMGVDGLLALGFVAVAAKLTLSLQANSESNDILDVIAAQQKAAREVYVLNGLIVLPGIRKKWTMTNGGLTGYPPMPDAGKTLKARRYTFTWETLEQAPI